METPTTHRVDGRSIIRAGPNAIDQFTLSSAPSGVTRNARVTKQPNGPRGSANTGRVAVEIISTGNSELTFRSVSRWINSITAQQMFQSTACWTLEESAHQFSSLFRNGIIEFAPGASRPLATSYRPPDLRYFPLLRMQLPPLALIELALTAMPVCRRKNI
ncbi:unnamed protein product, partial [Iphiclides podalirius]